MTTATDSAHQHHTATEVGTLEPVKTEKRLSGVAGSCGAIKTIGVRGTGPGCGKDTVADMIMKRLLEKNISSVRKRFATALKQTVSEYTGIPAEVLETVEGKNIVLESRKMVPITDEMLDKTMADYAKEKLPDNWLRDLALYGLRAKFLSIFGEAVNGRTVGQVLQLLGSLIREIFGPMAFVDAVFNKLMNSDIAVISDVRYKQENNSVKQRDGIVVFVKGGPLDVTKMAGRSLQHSSERDLDGVLPDITIDNNGTLEELEQKVKDLMDALYP